MLHKYAIIKNLKIYFRILEWTKQYPSGGGREAHRKGKPPGHVSTWRLVPATFWALPLIPARSTRGARALNPIGRRGRGHVSTHGPRSWPLPCTHQPTRPPPNPWPHLSRVISSEHECLGLYSGLVYFGLV